MTAFWEKLNSVSLNAGEIAIGWMGQSGFSFKTGKGTIVGVDVYLSDCAERVWGLKRLMAPVMSAEDFRPDILVATHFHEDHLDIDAMPVILNNGKTQLLSPTSSIERIAEMGLKNSRAFNVGDKLTIDDVELEAVFADHGEFVPDPIGMILTMEGISIYLCGDTSYCPDKIPAVIERGVDLIIPPINGANGNLGPWEAAALARDCHAKAVIPCHFWTIAEHLGSPAEFKTAMSSLYPDCKIIMLCQGEIISFKA